MRRRRTGLLFAVAALLMFVVPALSSADENPIDQSEYGHLSGGLTQLLSPEGVGGGSLPKSTCTSTGDPAANVRLNCDSNTSPDNETPIVADPTNPNHLLAGSNDYFITQKGSGIQERVPTGFFTSFDGGHTWIDGQIPMGNGANGGNGDPSPAFDAKFGTAHMAQLSAAFPITSPNAGHIDVSVSTSYDGGVTWKPPVTVDIGQASIGPSATATFLDKEWLVADNNPSSPHYGRLYLSWDRIELSKAWYKRTPGK